MSRPKIERAGEFLVDNGILFEINRQVLHPLGLQLELEPSEDGATCLLSIEDNRASPNPIYFSPGDFKAGRDRFEAYMEEHGRRNQQKRRQIGLVIQTGPNLPPHIHDGDDEGGRGS